MLTVYNLTRQAWLAKELQVADTFFARLVGLIGKGSVSPDTGLWIKNCNSVHTFGMRFPIDLVFLNEWHCVVKVMEAMQPFRVIWPVRQAASVIELPAYTVCRSQTQEGDLLDLSAVLADAAEPDRMAVGVC